MIYVLLVIYSILVVLVFLGAVTLFLLACDVILSMEAARTFIARWRDCDRGASAQDSFARRCGLAP